MKSAATALLSITSGILPTIEVWLWAKLYKAARRFHNPFSLCIESQSALNPKIAAWMPSKTNNCKDLGRDDATKIRSRFSLQNGNRLPNKTNLQKTLANNEKHTGKRGQSFEFFHLSKVTGSHTKDICLATNCATFSERHRVFSLLVLPKILVAQTPKSKFQAD